MFQRVMVAVVGIPFLLLVLIWAPDWATVLLLMAMCAIGAHELMHAAAGEKGKRLISPVVAAAAAVPLGLYFRARTPDTLGLSVSAAVLAAIAGLLILDLFVNAILAYGTDRAIPFADVTAGIFAGLVFPLLLGCLLLLRLMPMGKALVFLPLCISFGSDTFALFAGMLFGKHKLAPYVSPKKTVEGGIGGLLGGVIGMTLFKFVSGIFMDIPLSWTGVVLLGILGSVISQIGDLSFSVIKREFGVKDYGRLLPGHGGILDRFDSVTFVAPFVWLLIELVR